MKKYANFIGWLLSAVCLAFFVHHVSKVGLTIPNRTTVEIAGFVAVGIILYALGVVVLALVWRFMLRSDAGGPQPRMLIRSYLVGQFAKYLPGNVFQYAARHSLSATAGATHAGLVGAAFAEIYLMLCCGSAIAIAAASPILANIAPNLPVLPAWLGLLPLAAAFAVSSPAQLAPSFSWLPRMSMATVMAACSGYIGFFLIFGSLYLACLHWTTGTVPDSLTVVGSTTAAWIAGFVVPGPPAGAGVREATLTLGAGHQLSAPAVAASIILFRLLTLGGDFVAFLGGLAIRARRGISRGTANRNSFR